MARRQRPFSQPSPSGSPLGNLSTRGPVIDVEWSPVEHATSPDLSPPPPDSASALAPVVVLKAKPRRVTATESGPCGLCGAGDTTVMALGPVKIALCRMHAAMAK